MGPDREACADLDRTDPLGRFLERFRVSDPSLVYLDGNSLGRLPLAAAERLRHVVEAEWGDGLVESWEHWIDAPQRVGDRIGRIALGAAPGETVVADSTTVNLFKLLSAACEDRAGAVVVDASEFPTDRYVAAAVAAHHGRTLVMLDAGERLQAGPVAVVLRSVVDYRTGALADVDGDSAAAHAAGALALWDCSHAVGVVPLDLRASGADLAVGCSYKYLNGGPGAPAWLWVRADHQARLAQPIWGWMAQRDQFAMGPAYDQVDGIGAWLSGAPPILALAALDAALDAVEDAGVAVIRAKSELLTALAVGLYDEHLAPLGCGLATPREPRRRGGHVSVTHADAGPLCIALRERGVVPDHRAPDVVRLGLSPLTTRFTDVFDGVASLEALLRHGGYEDHRGTAGRVT